MLIVSHTRLSDVCDYREAYIKLLRRSVLVKQNRKSENEEEDNEAEKMRTRDKTWLTCSIQECHEH